jgi:hypothetical protein
VLAVILAAALGQAVVPAPVEAIQADQLARVRRALTEAPAITVPPDTRGEGPVFRVTIRQKPFEPMWDNWSAVPSNIRPFFRAHHHEFLEQVLQNRERSEVFRGPTLYPIGIEIIQLAQFLARHINAANQRRHEANVKEEVRLALEKFLACRTNSNRHGC